VTAKVKVPESTVTVDVRIDDLIDHPIEQKGARASLFFYSPRSPQGSEIVHLSSPDEIVIGRLNPADVCINDPSLSGQHARFTWSEGVLAVEDLRSRNGVWLDKKRIEKAPLFSGAELRLGSVHALVAIKEAESNIRPPSTVTVPGAENLVVLNPKMRAIYDLVAQVASAKAPVLILGETGTGKEHVAQAVHLADNRNGKPFKALNCGAVPRDLTESVLFGHEKGSFTGAINRSIGLFEQAHQGVLFLDEIGELSPSAQAAILRAVESKKITRIGSNKEIDADVRIVSATHCNVETMVENGTFRKDLLYRINTITIELPPLRARRDEIEPLCHLFLKRTCASLGRKATNIDRRVIQKLEEYDWPGNIRQLRNVIERCVLSCRTEEIVLNDLPQFIVESVYTHAVPAVPAILSADESVLSYQERLRSWEADIISRAMHRTAGNQRAAARLLRMPRRTLSYKLKAFKLEDKNWG